MNGRMKKVDVVLIIVVSILVIIVGFAYFGGMYLDQEQNYCKNWSETIEKQRKILENNFSPDGWSEFNRDVNEYNKECYY